MPDAGKGEARHSRRRSVVVLVLALLALAGIGAWLWIRHGANAGDKIDEGTEQVLGSAGGETSNVRLPAGAFVPSGPDGPALVWAVGDGGVYSRGARAVSAMVARSRPDRLLYLGDVYETGSAADFRDAYAPTYGRVAKLTAPTPGNHDWPEHAEGYDPYWKRVTGRTTPSFYKFEIAGWQVLSLNSEAPHGPGSAQVRWLRRQLRGPGDCRIAFWHRPRYSAVANGDGSMGDNTDVEPFWRALAGHARIVLNGHDHDLQRFPSYRGITELVSGAGGRARYRLRKQDKRLAFGNDSVYGGLRLDLRPGEARYTFVAGDERPLDAGLVRCSDR